MLKRFQFHAERAHYGRVVNIWGSRGVEDEEHLEVLAPVAVAKILNGDLQQPTMELSTDAAQNLLDALWAAGFRPVDGTGNVGQLGATQAHLADMRRLVAKQLEVDLP